MIKASTQYGFTKDGVVKFKGSKKTSLSAMKKAEADDPDAEYKLITSPTAKVGDTYESTNTNLIKSILEADSVRDLFLESKTYVNIVFLDKEEDFDDFSGSGGKGSDGFFESSDKEMFEYLYQWEQGDGGEESDEPPWGSGDNKATFKKGGDTYVLSYNSGLGYAGLCRVE